MITLNEQQENAKNKIIEWYNNGHPDKLIFVLAGYAGTGKTFLIRYIATEILKIDEDEIAFVAPTGKAASVLIQRGASNATTIHKMIYNRVEVEYETEINGKKVKSKKFEFIKKPSIPNYKLIIVDEVSMVEKKVMEDLISFGRPIVVCGDLAQLEAIGKQNGLLDNPDINLTQIVRQEENNMIVKLATMARNGEVIPTGDYGNVKVLNKNLINPALMKTLLTKSDQVICGLNRTRHKINNQIKNYLGLSTTKINENEKIICLLNNWEEYLDDEDKYALANGIIGYAHDIKVLDKEKHFSTLKFQAEFLDNLTGDLIFDDKVFRDFEFKYDFHQKVYLLSDGSYELVEGFKPKQKDESDENYNKRLKKYIDVKRKALICEQLNFFDSAYCISCHKSQGSEWNTGVIFDESCYFENPEKWLYTAITRFKKSLVIIK